MTVCTYIQIGLTPILLDTIMIITFVVNSKISVDVEVFKS